MQRGPVVGLTAAAVVALILSACSATTPVAHNRRPSVAPPPPAHSTVPVPTVEGPITGPGQPSMITTSFNPASVGYSENEYFISGTAHRYVRQGPAPADGRWRATPGGTAAYKTRLLVYRPADPAKFNGTVIVEWLNESVGSDTAPDWIGDHTELIKEGFAWVGVSAQAIGVNGGTGVLGDGGSGLKRSDPARYGSLVHPGDAYAYDIFSQAAQAVRHPRGVAPLGGLHPQAMIADGESQSAFFLTTYIDAVAPLAHVFDGYLVHSRWSGGTSLSGGLAFNVHEPFRTDLGVPILAFETETDLSMGNYARDRQPDSTWFRDWEVAGTAHADDYTSGGGIGDDGLTEAAEEATAKNMVTSDSPLTALGCTTAPNSGPQHWVLDTAVHDLNRWVRTGTPPPHGPRLEVTSGSHPTIRRDGHGNALGGIRTPEVEAPVAALSGNAPAGSSVTCGLFGSTVPFDQATLTSLYPTHAAYVSRFQAAAQQAVRAGFLLPADAAALEAAASASDVS